MATSWLLLRCAFTFSHLFGRAARLGWCELLFIVPLLLAPRAALAQEAPPEKVIAPNAIHVCVKPSWLNVDSNYWSYGPGDMPVKLTIAKFKERTQGHNTYVYDPWAPPENTALLPPPDNQLECAAPPPRPDKAAKKPADKPGDGGQAEKTTGKGNGTKPGAETKDNGADKPKKPTPEEEARIDDELKDLRSQAELEARARQRCRGEKLPCAKDHMAILEAMLSQRMNEELRSADGKKYGVVGGKNPDGIDHPAAQAAAVAVMFVASVISPDKLTKRLKEALEKKATVIINEVDKAGLEAVEKMVEDDFARLGAAEGFEASKSVAPYRLWQKVTDRLRGTYQAHHLYEKAWAEKFGLAQKELDDIPSVILTGKAHQEMTAELGRRATAVLRSKGKMTREALWEIYRKVYKDNPHWLAAIKEYFE